MKEVLSAKTAFAMKANVSNIISMTRTTLRVHTERTPFNFLLKPTYVLLKTSLGTKYLL